MKPSDVSKNILGLLGFSPGSDHFPPENIERSENYNQGASGKNVFCSLKVTKKGVITGLRKRKACFRQSDRHATDAQPMMLSLRRGIRSRSLLRWRRPRSGPAVRELSQFYALKTGGPNTGRFLAQPISAFLKSHMDFLNVDSTCLSSLVKLQSFFFSTENGSPEHI